MSRGSFEDALSAGAARIGLELSDEEVGLAARHFKAVLRWNKVHNLTRVTEPSEAASRHYLDAFAGLSLLESAVPTSQRVEAVDVGSGAGYPGMVGAIRWRSCSWTLLDAAAKRCSFLELSARELGLNNVAVLHADARQVASRWPLVVSRATFSAGQLTAALNLKSEGGRSALWIGERDVGHQPMRGDVLGLGATRVLLG